MILDPTFGTSRLIIVAWLALASAGCERIAPTGIEAASLATGPARAAQDVTGTYVFGASLEDAGNLAALGPFVPSPPYFQGRVSDGPVWPEYFADLLGTDATASLLGGSNYAVAGARASVPNFGIIPPYAAQVADYLEDAGGVADRRGLYVFTAPLNDVLAALTGPPEAARRTIVDALSETGAMLDRLYDAGARRFVLVTGPDRPTVSISQTLPDGTSAIRLVNAGLEALAANLAGRGVHVALFDLHGLVEDVVDDPAAFGLEIAHCSYTGKNFLTILGGDRTPAPCDPTVPVEGYMMFDNEHFTTTMHEIVAQELFACHRYLRGAGSAPAVSRTRCAQGRAR